MALVQPVAVTRNGRERTVMISIEEYQRLKRRDCQVLGLDDFSDEDIADLEKARAPASSKAFDYERKTQLRGFPEPVPGLVIRYSSLWMEEHRRGQE